MTVLNETAESCSHMIQQAATQQCYQLTHKNTSDFTNLIYIINRVNNLKLKQMREKLHAFM